VRKRRRICDRRYRLIHKFGCWTEAFIITWNGPKRHRSSPYGREEIMYLTQDNQWEIKLSSLLASFVSNHVLVISNVVDNVTF
jgi:hypothetical protein